MRETGAKNYKNTFNNQLLFVHQKSSAIVDADKQLMPLST